MKENPIAEIPLVSSREEYISPNDIRKSDPYHGLSYREHRTHRQIYPKSVIRDSVNTIF